MSNLPQNIKSDLDQYIERIKAIKWFKPEKFDKKETTKQVKVALAAFGVKASVEYRKLEKSEDWGAALGAARDAAWDAALDAAWDAAWGACEIVASDLPNFTKKYPKGAFLQLIPLWESGLYPIGIVNGKFIVYVPQIKTQIKTISRAEAEKLLAEKGVEVRIVE
jgi:hypothetical protein